MHAVVDKDVFFDQESAATCKMSRGGFITMLSYTIRYYTFRTNSTSEMMLHQFFSFRDAMNGNFSSLIP